MMKLLQMQHNATIINVRDGWSVGKNSLPPPPHKPLSNYSRN